MSRISRADMTAPDPTFFGFNPCSSAGETGFFFDFLGTKTRTEYLPASCQWLSGKVFGLPAPGRTILHEYEEWQGVIAAVRDAKNTFVAVELGAGWGPWLVTSHFAAKHLGIDSTLLVGVEAEAPNIEFMKTHFSDNGIDYRQHKIVRAAIDKRDASAASSHPGGAPLMSLTTLLKDLPIVDIIHCDIQFAEARAFAAGIGAVTDRVRRVVIGTHSRKIEDDLIETFRTWSWQLEHETPCKYRIENGTPYLETDGVQVWRNAFNPGTCADAPAVTMRTAPRPKVRSPIRRFAGAARERLRRMLS